MFVVPEDLLYPSMRVHGAGHGDCSVKISVPHVYWKFPMGFYLSLCSITSPQKCSTWQVRDFEWDVDAQVRETFWSVHLNGVTHTIGKLSI